MGAYVSIEKRVDKWSLVISRFEPAVSAIMSKATFDAYARSQLGVPVDTAFLKQTGSPDFDAGSLSGEIRYTAHYAGYVHDGTVRMPARPFLADAVEQVVPSMLAAFRSLESRLA